jgi:RND superfamily putative drug exporter
MAVSDHRVVGQVGTTIGLGLLFDTLVVRSFMMPSVAAMLGRWFWWPLNVRSRPARHRQRPPSADFDLGDRPTTELPASSLERSTARGAAPYAGE